MKYINSTKSEEGMTFLVGQVVKIRELLEKIAVSMTNENRNSHSETKFQTQEPVIKK